MEATQILMSEHRVIENVIASLEKAAGRLQAGKSVRPGFFVDASNFIQGFADGCHHRKEEGVLFKALVKNGIPEESGPVAVMLADHEQGRAFNRGMRAAAGRLEVGDLSAKNAIIQNALGYTNLLKAHIFKEDRILFPLADQVIPAADQPQVSEDFEHVEHEETGEGVHEKYLALANKLAEEME